jgi:hypothetical protein
MNSAVPHTINQPPFFHCNQITNILSHHLISIIIVAFFQLKLNSHPSTPFLTGNQPHVALHQSKVEVTKISLRLVLLPSSITAKEKHKKQKNLRNSPKGFRTLDLLRIQDNCLVKEM